MKIKQFTYLLLILFTSLSISCSKSESSSPAKLELKEPIITWANPSDIIVGVLLSATQLNATADVPGTFVYTPALGTILDADNGQVLKVVFTPTDLLSFKVVSKTVTVNVKPKDVIPVPEKTVPNITWAKPADITTQTLLSATQLNATANTPGTFVYTPAIGVKLSAGMSQVLKVDFTPTDLEHFVLTSKTVTINVTTAKETPDVVWTNPADIEVSTYISSKQLNATCNVAGTFTYTPAVNTLLKIGLNQSLTVEFIPTDNSKYATVSKTVKINVNDLTVKTVMDYDNNSYNTITIGNRVWTKENLKTTHYSTGDQILYVAKASWATYANGAQTYYNNATGNLTTYGLLYNFKAVETTKLCPIGWKVPSADEWTLMVTELGGSGGAGIKLKEAGTAHWINSSGITNSSNFTALPGGYTIPGDGSFGDLGYYAHFWTATPSTISGKAKYRKLDSNTSADEAEYDKRAGFAVRCIKTPTN